MEGRGAPVRHSLLYSTRRVVLNETVLHRHYGYKYEVRVWFHRAPLSMMGGTYSAKTRALSSEEGGRLSERLASIVANDKLAKTTPRSKAGCALQPWVALSR